MFEPPAPNAAELAKYDVIWHGVAHRNVCVRLHDGRATIAVTGSPDYELYVEPKTYTYARETPGRITIATPDAPHTNATVCLGIAAREADGSAER
jgi:hypothetical protein